MLMWLKDNFMCISLIRLHFLKDTIKEQVLTDSLQLLRIDVVSTETVMSQMWIQADIFKK